MMTAAGAPALLMAAITPLDAWFWDGGKTIDEDTGRNGGHLKG